MAILEGFLKRFNKGLLLYSVLAATLSAFCWTPAYGQDATGRVTGIIYDPSGATIADAHVTVTSVATKISRETSSDATGFYQVLALPVGYYTVSVEHQGFRSVTTAQSKLEINQTLKIDIKMEVGAATESVTVEALRTVCDLDLSDLDGIEPPRGFGRGLRAMPSHVPTPVDRRSVRRRRG